MKKHTFTAAAALFTALAFAGCDQKNEPTTSKPAGQVPAADNTANNKVDRSGETKTPMDQSQKAVDVEVTAAIRRAIMDDKAMSTNAQNVKIITTADGVVTLRGPVNSQAEKDSIEAKAKAALGVTRVDNQLEVKVP
jgi:hyperosmotically inducible periplasmic protein